MQFFSLCVFFAIHRLIGTASKFRNSMLWIIIVASKNSRFYFTQCGIVCCIKSIEFCTCFDQLKNGRNTRANIWNAKNLLKCAIGQSVSRKYQMRRQRSKIFIFIFAAIRNHMVCGTLCTWVNRIELHSWLAFAWHFSAAVVYFCIGFLFDYMANIESV